jgi:hypothetical protein
VRITDDGSDVLAVNGFLPTDQFDSPAHNYVIPTRFGPDGSLYLVTWNGGCCRAGLPGLGAGSLMRIDFVGEQADTSAPQVEASLAGNQDPSGDYINRATLTLSATDSSGVDAIEYSLDGGATWEEYTDPVAFTEPGEHAVSFRATDRANPPNTSAVEEISFTVIAAGGCVAELSDEFDGSGLDLGRWSFHHPTTPTSGGGAPSVAGGSLNLPLGAYSVDLTRPGPIGYIAQPIPEGDFTAIAEISAPGLNSDATGQGSVFAQAGLLIYQSDDDWIKVAHTRTGDGATPGSTTYFEAAYEDAGTRTLGSRIGAAPPETNLPTWWMRVTRSGSTITAAYSLTDPESPGGADWIDLGVSADLDQLMPTASGPRYIGPYGGNGSVTASFDYVRFEPDEVTCADTTPPTTAVTLDPPDPAPGPVTITFTASDNEGGSGIDRTEYRIDGASEWTAYDEADPPVVSAPGSHVVAYRSVDVAGNEEAEKTVSFTIEPDPDPTPSPTPPGGQQPGGGVPSASLGELPGKLKGSALAQGLAVSGSCAEVGAGTLRLGVSKQQAGKLGLGKKTTLASAAVTCDAGGFSAVLKADSRAKRALKRLQRSLVATLTVEMSGPAGAAIDSERVTLKAPRR